jgi:hypothetical protein
MVNYRCLMKVIIKKYNIDLLNVIEVTNITLENCAAHHRNTNI